jgi:hypothetical protein
MQEQYSIIKSAVPAIQVRYSRQSTGRHWLKAFSISKLHPCRLLLARVEFVLIATKTNLINNTAIFSIIRFVKEKFGDIVLLSYFCRK